MNKEREILEAIDNPSITTIEQIAYIMYEDRSGRVISTYEHMEWDKFLDMLYSELVTGTSTAIPF